MDLSNIEYIKKFSNIDSFNMYETVLKFPDQIEEALNGIKNISLNKVPVRNIVISAMGGSSIAAEILTSIFSVELNIPVLINRNYNIPEFVNQNTLFVPISYSGNTEETLKAYNLANLKKAHVIAITSGGKLELSCKKNNQECLLLPRELQARSSFVFIFFAIYKILSEFCLISDKKNDIKDAVNTLKSLKTLWNQKIKYEKNPVKKTAVFLLDKIPVIYSTIGLLEKVCLRWKTQINENAKLFALINSFPELNHNEIIPLTRKNILTDQISILVLRDLNESFELKKKVNLSIKLIRNHFQCNEVYCWGKYPLTKALSLVYFGDLLSIYLAVLNDIDPTPIHEIDYLKK